MNILDIIEKKKVAKELTSEEINYFIEAYTSKSRNFPFKPDTKYKEL